MRINKNVSYSEAQQTFFINALKPESLPGVLSFFFFSGRILLPGNTFRSETLNYYWMPIIVSNKLSLISMEVIHINQTN